MTLTAGRLPRSRWWLTLLLLALFAGGCGLLDRGEEEDPPAYPQVETLVVQPVGFRETIRTTGEVEALFDATLSAEIGGTLVRIAPEGAAVAAGQVVAELDTGASEAAARQAAAATLEAEAAVRQAQDIVSRQAPLVADTIISPAEAADFRARLDQAQARLLQARAREQEARARLEQGRLRAPFAGVVEEHLLDRGEQVTPGQPVVRLVRPGPVTVTAGIPERFAGEIREGASALVDLNAYGAGAREATVSRVGGTIDPGSRTFRVVLDLADPDGELKTGMIARVDVGRREIADALVLPLEAVLRGEREAVLVVEGTGPIRVLRRRELGLGPRSGSDVVVDAGLTPGEEVVVLGHESAFPGDSVRVSVRYLGVDAFRAAIDGEPRRPEGPGP
jgi:membrane fusion protein, multidrug efflux system